MANRNQVRARSVAFRGLQERVRLFHRLGYLNMKVVKSRHSGSHAGMATRDRNGQRGNQRENHVTVATPPRIADRVLFAVVERRTAS